jgi:hypothetical protein
MIFVRMESMVARSRLIIIHGGQFLLFLLIAKQLQDDFCR